ncbi:hypothetical protein EM20IM_08215 [Candidatus Methylacidiphilum infernorum]|uniref:Uncharacterized protein n=1 Tax=Candidatus Methylacidiphilum infernorum TaxID=511746 RepID=A0ABX7PV37_9BACT|nr:hypothetical protein [Candidatus Methylacidiphilum infernorum]QSR86469.1 hypothetical protein EM20IM_08215 [Candidatus Methylacidiphilum infernorum]
MQPAPRCFQYSLRTAGLYLVVAWANPVGRASAAPDAGMLSGPRSGSLDGDSCTA